MFKVVFLVDHIWDYYRACYGGPKEFRLSLIYGSTRCMNYIWVTWELLRDYMGGCQNYGPFLDP